MLSGKHLDHQPANSRLTLFPSYQRYNTENGITATREYVNLAREHSLKPAQMALAFVNQRPFMGANITGATNLEQLQDNLEGSEIDLSENLIKEIDAIHQKFSNPCP